MNEIKKAALTYDRRARKYFHRDLRRDLGRCRSFRSRNSRPPRSIRTRWKSWASRCRRTSAALQTAFSGSYGSGHPVIGILGEFDALSGLSQQGGAAAAQSVTPGGNGHGCGHNLLGAGSLAAAVGGKGVSRRERKARHRRFLRLPRRGGRRGQGVSWRATGSGTGSTPRSPGTRPTRNEVIHRHEQLVHSGATINSTASPRTPPETLATGRSALDAVELMNIGVQFLREHMTDDCAHPLCHHGRGRRCRRTSCRRTPRCSTWSAPTRSPIP